MDKLVADRAAGTIHFGPVLLLSGIPPAAWRYTVGSKSALDHALDGLRARLRPPKDATLRQHFALPPVTEQELGEWAQLLARVATVSVRSVELIDQLAATSPLNPANHPKGWRPAKAPKPAAAPAPPAAKPACTQLPLFS